jgi:hypothetical protein
MTDPNYTIRIIPFINAEVFKQINVSGSVRTGQ